MSQHLTNLSGDEALARLQAGNDRFASGECRHDVRSVQRRGDVALAQKPFAIILGCSDSRVPADIVFDQDLGDLFVVRVAGNIAAPSQVGSVEYAAEQFGAQLVVVMGHTRCGAVTAALQELDQGAETLSPGLRSIVDRIRTAIEPVSHPDLTLDLDARIDRAVRVNVDASVAQLLRGSTMLETLTRERRLMIVSAEYSLASGKVEFW